MSISFDKIIADFKRKKATLPRDIGVIAKRHFQRSFQNEGFTDATLSKWKGRKKLTKSDQRFIKKSTGLSARQLKKIGIDVGNAGRKILTKSRALRNSIGVGVASFERIEIQTLGITYGHYHNVGDTRDGVQRKFMGKSIVMNNDILKEIRKQIGESMARK